MPSATNAADAGEVASSSEASGDPEAPPPPKGKSFFLFGGFFQKIRQRWSGQQQPSGPVYAGPDFPFLAPFAYRPIAYGVPAIYLPNSPYVPSSGQPQQQHQQNQENKIIILHTGQVGQLSSYSHTLPYHSYPPSIAPAQPHVPTTLPNVGQQYAPYAFNGYGPVIYSNSPVPAYSPNYMPVPGSVAHNRPDTVATATAGVSSGCTATMNACNFG